MKYKFLFNEKNLPVGDEDYVKSYRSEVKAFIIKNFTITFKDKFIAESDKILAVGYFFDEGDIRTVKVERVSEIMKSLKFPI